jgi:hypothetical protein
MRFSVNQKSAYGEGFDQLLSDPNGEHYVDAARIGGASVHERDLVNLGVYGRFYANVKVRAHVFFLRFSSYSGSLSTEELLPRVDGFEIVAVYRRVEAAEFQDFRDETGSWSSFDLNDDVEGVRDIGLDCCVRHFYGTL